ncbi:MAG: hypothetical protein ACTSQJ_11350 [Promethearchaeota archaeon]
MEDKNRKIVALFVILGVFSSLVVGGVLVVTREIGITQDKARYFYNEYTSSFNVYVDDADEPRDLLFKSESTDDEDIWQAVIIYDNHKDKVDVSKEGFILDDDGKETDDYFFLWWEEEDLKLVDNYNGNGKALIAEVEEKTIRDPTNRFLNENETYIAVCKSSLVYLKGRFATQASFYYIIKRESDDRVVGDAIIDMTSGIAFELNLYEEGYNSVFIELRKTDFIISRNRYRLLAAATVILPFFFVIIYVFFRKKKQKNEISEEELWDCLFLGGIGLFAFWLDQFFDFWYTYTVLMPLVLIMHLVPIVLILLFKREFWHFIFIPLLELAIYGMFVFFNMGIFVLWLSYGTVMLWLALLAHYAFSNKEN